MADDKDKAPTFDPSQPYDPVVAKPPAETAKFDPSQPYEAAKKQGTTEDNSVESKTKNPEGFWGAAWNDLKAAGQGFANASFGPGAAIEAGGRLAQDYVARQQEGRSPLYNAAATVVSATPIMNTRPMEEAANRGDVAGVYGHAVVPVAQALTPLAAEGVSEIGERFPQVKSVATAPVRLASRAAEHAVNEFPVVSSARAAKGLMLPADEAAALKIRLPLRDVGLPAPKPPSVVSSEPFELQTPHVEREPAIQQSFPKVGEIPQGTTEPFKLTPLEGEREAPVQTQMELPQVQKPPTLRDLQRGIEESAGWKPLEPNVPIGAQPRSLGAGVIPPEQIPPRVATLPNVPLGSRVAVPISEEFGPMGKRSGEFSRVLTEEPARQAGGPPLRPNVSLREQPKTAEAPVRSEQARLEEKYPDKADRQMVHSNGEQIVDAIGNDPETMKAVHDLTNPDVRQAMINSGEDMGQTSIGNRKATGNQVTRQDAFNRLLQKGLTPKQIVKLARQPIS